MTQAKPRMVLPEWPPVNPQSVFEKVTHLKVALGRFGNSRKVPTSLVQIDADKSWIKISKRLLEAPELDAIQQFDRKLAGKITTLSVGPLPLFKGVYGIPDQAVMGVDDLLKSSAPERAALVEEAAAAYPSRIREAGRALRGVFDSTNYLSVQRFRSLYYFEWSWIEVGTPGKLAAISVELFREEKQKSIRSFAEAAELYRQVLRANLLELLGHARERLEPAAGGAKNVFRKSTLEKITTFLETFSLRNVGDDRELAGIVEQMRKLVTNVEPETLRSDEKLRAAVAKELGAIEQTVSSMVVAAPSRRIIVED